MTNFLISNLKANYANEKLDLYFNFERRMSYKY